MELLIEELKKAGSISLKNFDTILNEVSPIICTFIISRKRAQYSKDMLACDSGGRHPRAVLRYAQYFLKVRQAQQHKIPLPRGLRRPRQVLHRSHHISTLVQNTLPQKLLPTSRKP